MTTPTITTSKPFLTRSELAARWGCSLSTIKRREAGGELVPTRFGPRIVRYSMADITALEKPSAIEPRNLGVTPEIEAATAGQVSGTSVSGTTTNPNGNATSTASRKNR